ncbi:MAG: hypothetical protein GWP08_10030 [Nitrospiraceae bacterium]|nr:hypothetical protein [Nitrospiraceae bacterium]
MDNYREPVILGRTGLRVSRLGVGAGYGVPAAAVEKAFHEYGVNYLYWSLPRRRGMTQAIRHLAKTGRGNIVVALQSYDHSGVLLRRFFEKGLRSLGLDYADVLILGWYHFYPIGWVMDAAMRLIDEGKVRFLAMSGHRRAVFAEAVNRPDSPIDICMVRYNAAHRGAETDVFPFLPKANRPGVTTYTATRWGRLMNPKKMPPGETPLTSSECYRFALANPNVDLAFTAPKNMAEMDAALEALDAPPLAPEELDRIRRIGHHVHG